MAWLRRHPWEADCLLAAALFAGSSDQANVTVTSAALAATIIPRRRYAVAAFAVALAIGVAQIAYGLQPHGLVPHPALEPNTADLAIAVLLYTLAANCQRRTSLTGLAACLALSIAAAARWSPAYGPHPQVQIFAAAIGLGGTAVTAWVLGDSIAYRYRRAYYDALEERAARLEAERDAQARIAAAAERARELQEQRGRAVDESAARLRQIERDLHDGAQVRLTALAMTLGEIKENLETDAPDSTEATGAPDDLWRTRMLVSAAHKNAKETLAELRDLARGIHPHVLDRGLSAALTSLAETSPRTRSAGITRGSACWSSPSTSRPARRRSCSRAPGKAESATC
jgi:signal transduction histidine kinase